MLVVLHGNSGHANTSQHYVIGTLPVFCVMGREILVAFMGGETKWIKSQVDEI
jgi:hypothetical protein